MNRLVDSGIRLCIKCHKHIDMEKDGYWLRRPTDEVACMDCGLPRRKK